MKRPLQIAGAALLILAVLGVMIGCSSVGHSPKKEAAAASASEAATFVGNSG